MSSGPKDVGRLNGASVAAAASVRPRLRGVSHKYAFFASLACGVALILTASGGESTIAAAIYAGAVSALLGTSALYHRITWRARGAGCAALTTR